MEYFQKQPDATTTLAMIVICPYRWTIEEMHAKWRSVDPSTVHALKRALRRDLRQPLYYQLFLVLRELIERGDMASGELLPREDELAQLVGVSRITLRQALQLLAKDGFLIRQRGRGTRIADGKMCTSSTLTPPKSDVGPLADCPVTNAGDTQVLLLSWEHLVPPEPIREAFEGAPGELLIRCIRVRSHHGNPFGYYTSWTRIEHPDFNATMLGAGSHISLIRRCGIRIMQAQQMASAVRVSSLVAPHLHMQPGQAVMTIERRSFDSEQRLLELLEIQYRPDKIRYRMYDGYGSTETDKSVHTE